MFLALFIISIRLVCLVVLVAGCYRGELYGKEMYKRSIRYWSWWPVFSLLLCLASFAYGVEIGHELWDCCVGPWWQMRRLQHYRDLDPSVTSGTQVQDAGLVDFARGVDIDRSKGGCFVNDGHTFCIAPILQGGNLRDGLSDAPEVGTYDFFAVGMDCCTCPNNNFQCGEWNNPLAVGGSRSLDVRNRPNYKLATDQWSATYMKAVKHPLFFEWVQEPVYTFNQKKRWAIDVAVLAAFAPFPLLIGLVFVLDVIRQILVRQNILATVDTPIPPRGFERAWERFLPTMLKHALDEDRQLLGIPVGPRPVYGTTDRVTYT